MIAARQSGTTDDMPGGKVTIDPVTHHAIRDVYIAGLRDRVRRIRGKFDRMPPTAPGWSAT